MIWSCDYHVTAVGVCLINQVQCTTGGCVNSSQLCDDVIDCEDGSDEFTCSKPIKCHVINTWEHAQDTVIQAYAQVMLLKSYTVQWLLNWIRLAGARVNY